MNTTEALEPGTSIKEMPVDEHGRERWQWSATLGDGTRKGMRYSIEEAVEAAKRARRYLLQVESHDPDAMDHMAHAVAATPETRVDRVMLVSAWGGQIEVNESDVEQALANGCRFPSDTEPDVRITSESPAERKRRQALKSAEDELA